MNDLDDGGIRPQRTVRRNWPSGRLYEATLEAGLGRITEGGALAVDTLPYTGRSPDDKFLVREPQSEGAIWWGEVNRPFEPQRFDELRERLRDHLAARDLYVEDLFAGAEPGNALSVQVITESSWHALFARNLFLNRSAGRGTTTLPGFTVLHAPSFLASPERDGTRSEAFVVVSLNERTVLIGGTRYAGEIKKSIFSVMNYLMPERGVLPMHCSANVGRAGDTAIFFGLSGTGKTTLSTDPRRPMIGDDEHGWSDRGVFNFEGGCYAKVIRLSLEDEPLIYRASTRYEAVLENVVLDPETRQIRFDDDAKTENTRSAYPLSHLDNVVESGLGRHPENLFFLSADAFGVLPPIARLSREQAMYYFVSGYTAKVAGTERGVTEPEATFSACFGAPFLPLPPGRYAAMLGDMIDAHAPRVWMLNTGWTGGPYGVGERLRLRDTRALLHAALSGALDDAPYERDPVFGFEVPQRVPEVSAKLLTPRRAWADRGAYDRAAATLATMFRRNIERYAADTDPQVLAAGPTEG
jgi:phosphoenolpyruvate carboxykinase (ATP)